MGPELLALLLAVEGMEVGLADRTGDAEGNARFTGGFVVIGFFGSAGTPILSPDASVGGMYDSFPARRVFPVAGLLTFSATSAVAVVFDETRFPSFPVGSPCASLPSLELILVSKFGMRNAKRIELVVRRI